MVLTRGRAGSLWAPLLQKDAPALAEALATLLPGAALPTGPGGLTLLHACALLDASCCVAVLAAAGAPLDAALTHSYGEVAAEFAAWPLAADLQLHQHEQALEAERRPLDLAVRLGCPFVVRELLEFAVATDTFLTLTVMPEYTTTFCLEMKGLARHAACGLLDLSYSEQLEKLAHSLFRFNLASGASASKCAACLQLLQAPQLQHLWPRQDFFNWVLGQAAASGHVAVVQHALERGALNTATASAASVAAGSGHVDVLELLLDAGV